MIYLKSSIAMKSQASSVSCFREWEIERLSDLASFPQVEIVQWDAENLVLPAEQLLFLIKDAQTRSQ